MGSSYRRLEVQLPQFFLEVQREAEACAVEVLRMEKQVLRMEEQTAEKQAAFEDTEAKLLQKMRDAGPSDLGATEVPSLTLFLQQFWSDIQRDPDRVQAVRRSHQRRTRATSPTLAL
jgi:hypothetical protein